MKKITSNHFVVFLSQIRSNLFLLLVLLLQIIALIFFTGCEFPTSHESSEDKASGREDLKLIFVPAGEFTTGVENTILWLDYDYEIMMYPVTNIQYLKYLAEEIANGNLEYKDDGIYGYYNGDDYWPADTYEYYDLDDPDARIYVESGAFRIKMKTKDQISVSYDYHPVTEVTWFGARAFAEYYGMRLPTDNEWEKTARGNTGYQYPWGNWIDINRVNYWNSGDDYDNDTTPVGYFNGSNFTKDNSSIYGAYDMAGNVWEWTLNWGKYSNGRNQKGGAWTSRSIFPPEGGEFNIDIMAWTSRKNSLAPTNSNRDAGFRCVKLLN